MSRADMIRRTVALVTELRRVLVPCLDIYTRGNTHSNEPAVIPQRTVDEFSALTQDFGYLLEEIAETFREASEIELTVNTFATVRDYEHFHALLRRCTDFEHYWNRVEESFVTYAEEQEYLQFRFYTYLMGRYFEVILKKMQEIGR